MSNLENELEKILMEQHLKMVYEELQSTADEMIVLYARLRVFLIALKELHNPDVDRLFDEFVKEVQNNEGEKDPGADKT